MLCMDARSLAKAALDNDVVVGQRDGSKARDSISFFNSALPANQPKPLDLKKTHCKSILTTN